MCHGNGVADEQGASGFFLDVLLPLMCERMQRDILLNVGRMRKKLIEVPLFVKPSSDSHAVYLYV